MRGFKVTKADIKGITGLISNAATAGTAGLTISDEGTPLATPATSLNFVGAGVTASGAGAGKTITIPGGGALTWFNVGDYGAVHDGVTDDTVAIQAAITACIAAGGGWVYFPNGIYAIKGALQSTSTYNSQLTIPNNPATGSTPPIAIGFIGLGPAAQSLNGTSNAFGPSQSGAILLSDWAGTITDHPAVIAAGKWDAQYPAAGFNWIEVTFRNIEIRTPANPKLSGIQMASTATLILDGVTVSTNATSAAAMAHPSNTNAVGVTGPLINNANQPYLFEQVFIDGYYTGILASEVLHGLDIAINHCPVAIELAGPQFHASHFERVLIVSCDVAIRITGGVFYFDVVHLDIEHSIGSGTFPRYFDIDDPSNFGRGFVIWHTVKAGVGVDHDLSINGGTGMEFVELEDVTFGGAAFATPAIVLGTAAAAGAATTVIRSDSTIAAFDATVPTTQALGDAAATGSVAKAARRDHLHGMPALSTATPLVESGAGAVGTAAKSSREDHVHPAAASVSDTPVHVHVDNLTFSGDGATTDFELPASPVDAFSVAAYIVGVRTAITVSGSILTNMNFAVAPASGTDNIIVDIAAAVA